MLNKIIAACFLVFFLTSSAFLFMIALAIWTLTVLFDRRLVILHMFTSAWACLYLWIMPPWSVRIAGREKIRKGGQYIIVSNHQSQLDILVAFRLFFPFKWVSKIEVFRVPFIGWNMALNRYIKLKRGDKESIAKMMTACEASISRGNSIFFFPEGTRSETGELRPFKHGAFTLAKTMRLPILMIAINGTRKALPKHSLNFHGRHDICIAVLGEIPYDEFKNMPVEELADKARKIIANEVTNSWKP